MATYITVDEVRTVSGDTNEDLSDARITTIIDQVEGSATSWLNTVFTPTTKIEALDGNGLDRITLSKNPVLRINSMESNGETITPAYVHVYRPSGLLVLDGDSEVGALTVEQQSVIVSYLYGLMEESSTNTTTTAATTAGTSVSVSVSDSSSLSAEDWVDVYGTDGHKEAAQISSITDGSTIVVDRLSQSHASGSTVVKLQTPERVKRYLRVKAAIEVAGAIMGATSKDKTSYSLGDLQVTKGEPYTQWWRRIEELRKEEEKLRAEIRPRPFVMS